MTLRVARVLAPSLTLRRALFSLLAAAIALAAAGGTLGYAAADPARLAPGDVPHTFGVAPLYPGDRGAYTVEIRSDSVDGSLKSQDQLDYRFEVQPRQGLLDAAGRPHLVDVVDYYQVFRGVGESGPWRVYRDVATGETIASGQTSNRTDEEDGAVTTTRGLVINFLTPDLSMLGKNLPCGILNTLQGTRVDPLDGVSFPGGCKIPISYRHNGIGSFGPEDMHLALSGIAGTGADSLLAFSGRFDPDGKPDRAGINKVDAWFSPAYPVPIRWVVQHDSGDEGVTVLVRRLAAFERGSPPSAVPPALPDPAPRLLWSAPQPWGMDDGGIDHPFPLSRAFIGARDDPQYADLRDFLRERSGWTSGAAYSTLRDNSTVSHQWRFTVTDGTAALRVCASFSVRKAALDLLEPNEEFTYETCPGAAADPEASRPATLPTAASLMARWRAYAGPDYRDLVPNEYGFSTGWCNRCTDADDKVVLTYFAGHVDKRLEEPLPVATAQTPATQHTRESVFRCDGACDAQGDDAPSLWEGVDITRENWIAAPALPGHEQEQIAAADAPAPVRAWMLPEGAYAVGAGVVALLAGALYWLWPSLKGLLSAALFSRVERPRALDHPVRSEVHALIAAEPGIHLSEIMRRTGRGAGVVRHHVDKLVHVGLVSSRDAGGRLCFFPAGAVDRRLMDAAGHLKAAGARQILSLASARPGLTGQELAAAAGLDPGTVSYHLRKLVGVGVLRVERDGRARRVHPTDVARMALAN